MVPYKVVAAAPLPTTQFAGTSEHFVWHPQVHHYFDESLTFFIARVGPISAARMIEQVKQTFSDLNQRSWNAYSLYGADDLLIRAWLGNRAKVALSRHLENEFQWDVQVLDCSEISYLWWTDIEPVDDDVIARSADDIMGIAETGTTAFETCADVIERIDNRLWRRVPPRAAPWIKVYVVFDKVGFNHAGLFRQKLQSELDSATDLREITTHRTGDGSIVVKAVTDTVRELSRGLDKLDPIAGTFGAHCRTMIVRASAGVENDSIGPQVGELPVGLRVFVDQIAPELQPTVGAASWSSKALLSTFANDHMEVVTLADKKRSTLCHRLIRSLIMFIATGDGQELTTALRDFFPEFEDVLAKSVIAIYSSTSPDWYRKLRIADRLEEAGVRPLKKGTRKELGGASLVQQIRILTSVGKESEQVAAEVERRLGENWHNTLTQAERTGPLRNDVVHRQPKFAKDYSHNDVALAEWASWLMTAASTYFKLGGEK